MAIWPAPRPAFPALLELLSTGRTAALPQTPPVRARDAGGPAPVVPDRPLELYPSGEDVVAGFLGADVRPARPRPEQRPRTRVTMRHGDLRFGRHPVLVGHYFGDPIDGSEAALDAALDHALSAVRDLNLYPGALETCEVILRAGRTPPGAVVAGSARSAI